MTAMNGCNGNMALANVAVVTDHFQLSAICERKLPKEQLTS